jgi:glycosyltransferase involved in cell wall biosynthesis
VKILWVKSDFLHPTTKGGQIRTLEMLRQLHRHHEIHYVAFDEGGREGVERSREYSTRSYPVPFRPASKRSPRFALQLARGVASPLPVVISRYRSAAMQRVLDELQQRHSFDAMVCDFLTPSINIKNIERFTLFQHNVETMIWRRHAEHASDPVRRLYLRAQAGRMFRYERDVCRRAAQVIAVSPVDRAAMRELFGVERIREIATGVDIEYFQPPASATRVADLVFVGSMDWMPNIHAMRWFVAEVLPLIRRGRPDLSIAIVGRDPSPEILALAAADPNIRVTGTVPDVRPYLWGSLASIVPIHIGGGTRLKIYESMAARTPVVSTSVGAEGLSIDPPRNIRIADEPATFAAACIELLENEAERERLRAAAWEMVASRFSWEKIAADFADALESRRAAA